MRFSREKQEDEIREPFKISQSALFKIVFRNDKFLSPNSLRFCALKWQLASQLHVNRLVLTLVTTKTNFKIIISNYPR